MYKVVSMSDLYPVMEDKLNAGGSITLTVTGFSMAPMLIHQRDTVVLELAPEQLKIHDVVLYRRESGQFVLHRIVGKDSNGEYVLCGDNQFVLEHNIVRHQVVGRLQAFTRKGRYISCASPWYKAYVYLLPLLRALKHGLFLCQKYATALKRRILRLMNGNG